MGAIQRLLTGRSSQFADSASPSQQDIFDITWGKKYFVDNALLPANLIKQFYTGLVDPPDGAWGGPWTRTPGEVISAAAGGFGYDLGAGLNNIFFLVCGMGQNVSGLYLTVTTPVSETQDGYNFLNNGVPEPTLRRWESGFNLDIATRNAEGSFSSSTDAVGWAVLYNKATNRFRLFLREGAGSWYTAIDVMNADVSGLRWATFMCNATCRFVQPLVIYTD